MKDFDIIRQIGNQLNLPSSLRNQLRTDIANGNGYYWSDFIKNNCDADISEQFEAMILPTKPKRIIKNNQSDNVFAIKNHNNMYFAGYNKWTYQIRKAQLYNNIKFAEKTVKKFPLSIIVTVHIEVTGTVSDLSEINDS
ncbi:hypothetical protein J6A31_06330 [bacterium]|nr:hypothetical protein [bacterium]